MSILSQETILESGKLFKELKLPKPKFGHVCCELDSMSEYSGFGYIKSHVTLHVKSEAQKVNCVYISVIKFLSNSQLFSLIKHRIS